MQSLSNRYLRELGYLFSQDEWIRLEEISKGASVSKSTVWRDLAFLESILPEEWKIEKDELRGIHLQKPQGGTLENLWSEVRKHCSYFQILKLILFNNGITRSKISDYFHISRSTIHRQLEKIHQVVERAGIKLTSSPYKLIGEEKKIRSFYMQFWELVDDDTRSIIDSYESMEFIRFQKDLNQILSEHSIVLHAGAFQRLMVTLNISNMRIIYGNYVSFPMKVVTSFKGTKYFEIANKLFQCQYIKQCPDEDSQLYEILYIAIHIMAEEKSLNHFKELYDFRSRMKNNEGDLLSHLLKHFSNQIGFDLTDDDIFLSYMLQVSKKIAIANHFKIDTATRGGMQYLQYVEDHTLFRSIEEILVAACSNILEEEIRKEYILDIFFLLQAAILRKRNKHSIRIALTGFTFVEMDYLYEVLNAYLGNRATISTLDEATFNMNNHHNQFDLLIATNLVNVNHVKHISIIRISSVPTSSELLKIENFVENHFSNVLGLGKENICTFSTSVSLG